VSQVSCAWALAGGQRLSRSLLLGGVVMSSESSLKRGLTCKVVVVTLSVRAIFFSFFLLAPGLQFSYSPHAMCSASHMQNFAGTACKASARRPGVRSS